MIIIIKMILIYFLLGSLIYLYAQTQADKEITQFQEELFLLLGFIFKIPIQLIILIDGTLIPYIKYKKAIKFVQVYYGLKLINPFINQEDKNLIKNRRDKMIELLNDVYYNWDEGDSYEE